MSLTVKRLIMELEKFDNKFLEVEVLLSESYGDTKMIKGVIKGNKKVLLLTQEPKRLG